MKTKLFLFSILGLLLIATGCKTSRSNERNNIRDLKEFSESHFLDSILQIGLEHEAVYTLLSDLKPMSSLVSYSFPIANTNEAARLSGKVLTKEKHGKYLNKLNQIQKDINKLNIPDLKFIVHSYKQQYKNLRIVQIEVVRISALKKLLKEKENFFGQFGLVPETDPSIVVSTIENSDSYERWRGYGYMFGYPDYAVDFFVKAETERNSTKKFVERKFFNIPTFNSDKGEFVYAYPKDYVPTYATDSVLYYKASKILDRYKDMRKKHLNQDGTLQSYKFLLEYSKENR